MRIDGYTPIEGYAAIGDGRTAALVSPDGAVEWLCLPSFDSPSVFAAMLDAAKGGRFVLAPEPPFEVERRYLPQTNVLETVYRAAGGSARVTEAFTLEAGTPPPWRELARRVEGLEGSLTFRWAVEPRFDFGRHDASFVRADRGFVADGRDCRVGVLAWDAGEPRLAEEGAVVSGGFATREGSRSLLVLVGDRVRPLRLPSRASVERRLDETTEYWRRWLARCSYDGGWTDAVERSLLALKLLQNPETGAIAAAATTSLPEKVGGQRNMDYRFGWIRDVAFTLEALMRLGLEDDTHRSYLWLMDAARGAHPRPAPLYRLDGSPVPPVSELDLAGYRSSRPVQIGNQARSQLQLGCFGDLFAATWMHVERGGNVLDAATGERLADLADVLAGIWRHPDAGLWELPDEAQYASSKIGCWVAFDRALRLADRGQMPARHVERWRQAREEVRSYIEQALWSAERRTYLMKEGSDLLDCAVLLAGRRGFADPAGERLRGTIAALRENLDAGGPLLYRYSGMREKENAFLACSFWLVEALALGRRFDEAAELMDGLVQRSSPLGLYSEEHEPEGGALVGNVPQALTHLSLLTAAAIFEEALHAADAERPPARSGQPHEHREELQPQAAVTPLADDAG